MSDENKRLPFLLYDAMLDAMSRSVHGATALARSLVAASPASAPAPSSGEAAPVKPGQGGPSTAAMAAALDQKARAALAIQKEKTADRGAANIEALAVDAPDMQPKPEREAGPKPFKPQVGP